MHFKRHSRPEGEHAFLSPSYYHWLNYTPEKLETRWHALKAALAGTEQHIYAAHAIENGIVQDDDGSLLSLYINECIAFRMHAEVVLWYSDNCYGTADAIAYRRHKLRISDLKTGVNPTSVHQPEIYAALFCLEYDVDPYDIARGIELRIYQGDEVRVYDADPADILSIMKKIIIFDHHVNRLKREEAS